MTTEKRREKIIKKLKDTNEPIKGTTLANEFNVSRQVIVQDVAILRARGEDIIATPLGYMIPKYNQSKILKTITTRHLNVDEANEELMIMIENGATVVDVKVNHPIYGEVEGLLNIRNKEDVEKFIEEVKSGKVEFLASLNKGIHTHTIEVKSNEDFINLKNKLEEEGYLVEEL